MEREQSINARLPEDLETPSLRGIEIGQSAWSVPWAMEVDSERRCWLKATFTGHKDSGGTVSMLVRRVEEGFIVDLSRMPDDETWDTQYATDAEEIDGQDPENPKFLPVVQIIR